MIHERPARIQLSRRKGWTMPAGAVRVDRSTKWGNPFTITEKFAPGTKVGGGGQYIAVPTLTDAIECYRLYLENKNLHGEIRRELAGKTLACWCPSTQACHADVLLEIANP